MTNLIFEIMLLKPLRNIPPSPNDKKALLKRILIWSEELKDEKYKLAMFAQIYAVLK